ncbi:MAG: cytochrome c maturation protein CcmE [bacterium]|jgi:cytochrome c-type biogenesis protein CcmE|nr:cytochrome c maturation protein CcmE [bacterium]
MKKTHIVGLLVIAVAIFIIISTTGDASSYKNFTEAKEMAEGGNNSAIHVVGTLKKVNDQVVGIQESPDKLSFYFTMVDQNNVEQKVFRPDPMPTDFLRSEQVVVIGSYREETFVADKILLKCPSKYKEEEVKI